MAGNVVGDRWKGWVEVEEGLRSQRGPRLPFEPSRRDVGGDGDEGRYRMVLTGRDCFVAMKAVVVVLIERWLMKLSE